MLSMIWLGSGVGPAEGSALVVDGVGPGPVGGGCLSRGRVIVVMVVMSIRDSVTVVSRAAAAISGVVVGGGGWPGVVVGGGIVKEVIAPTAQGLATSWFEGCNFEERGGGRS